MLGSSSSSGFCGGLRSLTSQRGRSGSFPMRRQLRWAVLLTGSVVAWRFLTINSMGWSGTARPQRPLAETSTGLVASNRGLQQRSTAPPGMGPVVMRSTSPGVSKQVEQWVRSLIDSMPKDALTSGRVGAFYELAVEEAGRVLMAVAPVMGAVTLADSLGLIYVADVADILDAQYLINSGQAATATLAQAGGRINLQLLMRDGSDFIIELFRGA
mmetsp:Transcript_45110/g.104521  ORF Transcript_45110/g.104521 Transcript_45110/m.104521 type:complete len:214 (-) Transcript_45110:106-747(-)